MPPKYVKTIQEEIYYEYAKLICRSVYGTLNGRIQRGFITNRFKDLCNGNITMSGTIREWEREQEFPKECVFCRSTANLEMDHLIPRSRGGPDSADNMVWACKKCNMARSNRGVFEWLGLKKKDSLHRLVAGKYLKELLALHEAAGTLDIDEAGIMTLCSRCSLGAVCREWGTEHELTCLCLESIIG